MVNVNSSEHKLISLTNREKQVLTLICKGYTTVQVGQLIHLSPYTIVSHKKKLLQKFKAKNRVHLGVLAERFGFLRQENVD